MLSKLFGKKNTTDPVHVIARLNDRAQPLDRGDLYEDPLDEILKQAGMGSVTGGGTQLGEDNEIQFCDVEIQVTVPLEEATPLICSTLESLGAPIGSKLIFESDNSEVALGKTEGLAVYLNGVDLPDHVYQECDFDTVSDEFTRLLDGEGKVHSYWQGPRETALYMYGNSFQDMKQRLNDFLLSYPLCQQARVEQIAG